MDTPLYILLALPLVGAIACATLSGRAARTLALVISLLTLGVGLTPLLTNFSWDTEQIQLLTADPIRLDLLHFSFKLGVDTISYSLVLLTLFLTPLAIAASFRSITDRANQYYAWMLTLLSFMLGVFVARDLLLFYAFFELTLIPMFFIIGIWGGPQRRSAAGKFFVFTFAGSVFTLASVIYLGNRFGTFDIADLVRLAQSQLSQTERFWVLLGFLAGFSVKVPLFPVHTWLPLAHTEAPTAGSVILAGVLLKLGTYGILRLALPIGMLDLVTNKNGILETGIAFPQLTAFLAALCVIGILYGALVAWVQEDIKKLVAYSSVSHLGFCVLGLLAFNHEGIQGSVLYMINHGLSTGALFLVIGMVYDRYHTRDINQLSGLAKKMPVMAFFFILFTLSSIGLPGLNGFASEFLTILGAFKAEHLGRGYGALAALGIILGAIYMLHMAARVIWGPLKTPDAHGDHDHAAHTADDTSNPQWLPTDLSKREIAILIPIALAVVVLGVVPAKLLNTFEAPVSAMIHNLDPVQAESRAQLPPAATPVPLAQVPDGR